MTTVPQSFVHCLAAWNERDPERIRAHLDRSVAKPWSSPIPRTARSGPPSSKR